MAFYINFIGQVFYICLAFFTSMCLAFTIEELKAINYEVDLLQTPLKKGEVQDLSVIQFTSIFGQEYQCVLGHIEDSDSLEKPIYNENSTDIKELLRPLLSGDCLRKARYWWTYELCFGQYINRLYEPCKQFHIEDGQIIGQVLTLGLYEYDYDWNDKTHEEKHTKRRYHSQYYVNGTKCDLTGLPRSAEVRIFCEEDSGDYIYRVDEPGTCNYVLTVHTSSICSHPQLKPLSSKKAHTIPCHPLLSEEQYSSYIEVLNELEKLKSFTSPEKFAGVKQNIQEYFETALTDVVEEENSELSDEDKNDAYMKLTTIKNTLLPKKDKVQKDVEDTKSFNEAKSDITESVTKEKEEDNQVRIRRLDRANSDGNLYEVDEVQQKKLEKAIKEKLEKYGINTEGRKIEVKVIKAGYYGSHLTDADTSQFENMITALLTGEQEAIQEMERNKRLEENYKFTWKIEEDEEDS